MASSFGCFYSKKFQLWLAVLLAFTPLEAGSQLHRAYQLTVKVIRYSNADDVEITGFTCDYFSKCDPRFEFWLKCEDCVNDDTVFYKIPKKLKYPGENLAYDEHSEESDIDFTKFEPLKFYYTNRHLPKITGNLKIVDSDSFLFLYLRETIFEHSIQIEDLEKKRRRVVPIRKEYGISVDFFYSIECIPLFTCKADCVVPNAEARCENGLISCHDLKSPIQECQVVWGKFIFSFYLLSYNATNSSTLEGSASCTRNMTLLVHDRLTERKDEKWSIVFSTTKGHLGDWVEHDDINYFYYYARNPRIMFPNVSVSIRVWNDCSNSSETYTETWPAKVGEHYLKSPASSLQQFAGYFEIGCQIGYEGSFCTENRPNRTYKESPQCIGVVEGGPSCFYQLLCAQRCHNGATCMVKRESRDNYTASCMCALGFSGSYCDIYNDNKCMEDSCHGRGNCTINFNSETHNIVSFNCSCKAGYAGQRCEVCVSPDDYSTCTMLAGNYALLVGLRSITNTNGMLYEGSHCDAGRSHCDTQVEACMGLKEPMHHCAMLLKAPNTSSFNSSHALQAGFEYAYLEHNLSYISSEEKFYIPLYISDYDTDNPHNVTMLFSITTLFEFSFRNKTLQTIEKSHAGEIISFEYFVTLRCARGFTGIGCNTPCNASDSYDDLLAARNRIDSMNSSSCLFPRSMVCPDNSVGPSCAMKNLCANFSCGAGHQCTMAYNSAAVHCERVPDACERGLETCSRHGACHVSTLDNQQAFCTCDEGHGGDFCAVDKWCINGSKTKLCKNKLECLNVNNNNYSFCRCLDYDYVESFDYDNEGCYTDDPCERLRCNSAATSCKYNKTISLAFCACPSGLAPIEGSCERVNSGALSFANSVVLMGVSLIFLFLVLMLADYFVKKQKIAKLKTKDTKLMTFIKSTVNTEPSKNERSIEHEKEKAKQSDFEASAPLKHSANISVVQEPIILYLISLGTEKK